jgi:DNA replication and repair protein RecF
MILKGISLRNFRNYDYQTFALDPLLTLIVAPNAHGKTNLLEAIYFASNGRGFSEDKKEELVRFDEKEMEVRMICTHNEVDVEFKAALYQADGSSVKSFFIDKTKKGLFYYSKETPPVVLFSPSFMNIIEGSPSKRRMFVDTLLARIDLEYKKRLRNYENGMRRRNKVIEKERDIVKLREELAFWDDYLIEQADYITEKRRWFAEYTEHNSTLVRHTFKLDYLAHVMSKETLEASFEKQYYQRRTLVGPQRDDFRIIKVDGEKRVDVHTYASRGEQRLALLWLILHQLNIFVEHLEYRPILLLDDILSELDEGNKGIIQELVSMYQTVVTSAEEVPEDILHPGKVIRV